MDDGGSTTGDGAVTFTLPETASITGEGEQTLAVAPGATDAPASAPSVVPPVVSAAPVAATSTVEFTQPQLANGKAKLIAGIAGGVGGALLVLTAVVVLYNWRRHKTLTRSRSAALDPLTSKDWENGEKGRSQSIGELSFQTGGATASSKSLVVISATDDDELSRYDTRGKRSALSKLPDSTTSLPLSARNSNASAHTLPLAALFAQSQTFLAQHPTPRPTPSPPHPFPGQDNASTLNTPTAQHRPGSPGHAPESLISPRSPRISSTSSSSGTAHPHPTAKHPFVANTPPTSIHHAPAAVESSSSNGGSVYSYYSGNKTPVATAPPPGPPPPRRPQSVQSARNSLHNSMHSATQSLGPAPSFTSGGTMGTMGTIGTNGTAATTAMFAAITTATVVTVPSEFGEARDRDYHRSEYAYADDARQTFPDPDSDLSPATARQSYDLPTPTQEPRERLTSSPTVRQRVLSNAPLPTPPGPPGAPSGIPPVFGRLRTTSRGSTQPFRRYTHEYERPDLPSLVMPDEPVRASEDRRGTYGTMGRRSSDLEQRRGTLDSLEGVTSPSSVYSVASGNTISTMATANTVHTFASLNTVATGNTPRVSVGTLRAATRSPLPYAARAESEEDRLQRRLEQRRNAHLASPDPSARAGWGPDFSLADTPDENAVRKHQAHDAGQVLARAQLEAAEKRARRMEQRRQAKLAEPNPQARAGWEPDFALGDGAGPLPEPTLVYPDARLEPHRYSGRAHLPALETTPRRIPIPPVPPVPQTPTPPRPRKSIRRSMPNTPVVPPVPPVPGGECGDPGYVSDGARSARSARAERRERLERKEKRERQRSEARLAEPRPMDFGGRSDFAL